MTDLTKKTGSRADGTKQVAVGDVGDPIAVGEADQFLGVHRQKMSSPDEQFNQALANYQSGLSDWITPEGLDLAELHGKAQEWLRTFRTDELLPTEWKGKRIELPDAIHLSFERRPANVLGSYTYGRSSSEGTRWNVGINPRAIIEQRRSDAQIASFLLRCAIGLAEDDYRRQVDKGPSRGRYRSKEFCLRAERLGVPVCSQNGAERGIVPDGPFDKWVIRHGVLREFFFDEAEEHVRGTLPKRIVWRCSCVAAVPVMVARESAIDAVCRICGAVFRPARLSDSMVPGKTSRRLVRRDRSSDTGDEGPPFLEEDPAQSSA